MITVIILYNHVVLQCDDTCITTVHLVHHLFFPNYGQETNFRQRRNKSGIEAKDVCTIIYYSPISCKDKTTS